MEIKGEMHCPKCYAGAVADAKEKVDAVKKSLGI
jgi:phosphoglucomutase